MKKAAFFVEGQTELIFVRKLLEEIANPLNIAFEEEKFHAKSYVALSSDPINDQAYFALIVDCGSDGAVVSAMLDRYDGLVAANYELIVGLRDLYPLTHADLLDLRTGIGSVLPPGPPLVDVVIALTEVEAWFMQENTHFHRIDEACTKAAILAAIGYDIDLDLAENLPHPAKSLNDCYKIAKKSYNKSKKKVSRTIKSLDFAHLYLDRRARLASFNEFALKIEDFLT
ncbi:DUF4276 family protein [Aminobacter anthyllidis]|uniref:DUF4276 family protein n=1 Tax=Aminobacter anthyllidis TaxID=1035067 RepID=UPI0024571852|nr:DUF4276 family protein [Aminobacter anthyllidis]MDH4985111.1 DUF4276 family protein [Aminobacter anthyllidis]